jgi:hypothetical protein
VAEAGAEACQAPARAPKLTHVNPRGVHRATTVVVSAALVVLGVALIVEGVAASHGVNSARLLLGVLFVAAGTARLVVQLRRDRGR